MGGASGGRFVIVLLIPTLVEKNEPFYWHNLSIVILLCKCNNNNINKNNNRNVCVVRGPRCHRKYRTIRVAYGGSDSLVLRSCGTPPWPRPPIHISLPHWWRYRK